MNRNTGTAEFATMCVRRRKINSCVGVVAHGPKYACRYIT